MCVCVRVHIYDITKAAVQHSGVRNRLRYLTPRRSKVKLTIANTFRTISSSKGRVAEITFQ